MNKKAELFDIFGRRNQWVWIFAITFALMFTGVIPNLFHLSTLGNSTLITTNTTQTQAEAEQAKAPIETPSKYTQDTSDTIESDKHSFIFVYLFPLVWGIYLIYLYYRKKVRQKKWEKLEKTLTKEKNGKTNRRRSK